MSECESNISVKCNVGGLLFKLDYYHIFIFGQL